MADVLIILSRTHHRPLIRTPRKMIVSYLCSCIENLQSRVGHLEKHTGNMGNAMGEIRKSHMHLSSNVKETKKEAKELKLVNEQLQSKITDLQARSIRENLLFFGLAEYRVRGRENCAGLTFTRLN